MARNIEETLYSYGAPAVLILVALLQICNVQINNLTPWKGGGFGMFSFIDSRFVKFWLITSEREYLIDLPPRLDRAVGHAVNVPTIENMRRLAQIVWENRLNIAQEVTQEAVDPAAPLVPFGKPSPSKIRIELWQVEFHFHTARLQAKRVATYSFAPGIDIETE